MDPRTDQELDHTVYLQQPQEETEVVDVIPEYSRQGSCLVESTDTKKLPITWERDNYAIDQEGLFLSGGNPSKSLEEVFPIHKFPDQFPVPWVPTELESQVISGVKRKFSHKPSILVYRQAIVLS